MGLLNYLFKDQRLHYNLLATTNLDVHVESIYLSVCLSVCLPVCLSIYLSIYLYIYLSIYLWDVEIELAVGHIQNVNPFSILASCSPIYFVYSSVSINWTFTIFIGQCPIWLAISTPPSICVSVCVSVHPSHICISIHQYNLIQLVSCCEQIQFQDKVLIISNFDDYIMRKYFIYQVKMVWLLASCSSDQIPQETGLITINNSILIITHLIMIN